MAVDTRAREWAVPAGEVLAEALEERGWSQAELARRTDRPQKTINEIIKGKTAITPDTALQLERVLGIPAHIWLNLERNYGEWQARSREWERLLQKSDWVGQFPIADLTRHGLISRSRSKPEKLASVLRFFAVANESAWEKQWLAASVALRRSPSFEPRAESLAAWLRWGELEAEKLECEPFSAHALAARIAELRTLTTLDPFAFEPLLRRRLAEVGVAFVMVPELAGTRVSGAARWLSQEKAMIQLSLRHKRDDQFWFTVFHELGHLLRGSRRTTYVDVHIEVPDNEKDELLADTFASEALVPRAQYDEFVRNRVIDPKAIEEFAANARVAPGIVLGRLQHDNLVAPSKWNYLKRSIDFAD